MEEKTIRLDLSHTALKIDEAAHQEEVTAIDQSMKDKTGRGSDFLGWLDYPLNYDKKEHDLLKKTADYIRSNYDVLVVAGIGGSYLGARAAIDALKGLFHDEGPEIVYLGQTLDPDYVHGALNHIKDKKFAVNVISKSGTTTETSVAFRLLREMAEAKYGKEGAAKAIVATTDAHSGALLKLSQEEGYVRFVLPGDIGGRYSVQTPVGLFPIAVAGIDPTLILEGSAKAREDLSDPTLSKNDAYRYALARHLLYKAGNASSPTSRSSSSSANGGSSSLGKAKARKARASSRPLAPSRPTSTRSDSSSRKEARPSSRRSSTSRIRPLTSRFHMTRPTSTGSTSWPTRRCPSSRKKLTKEPSKPIPRRLGVKTSSSIWTSSAPSSWVTSSTSSSAPAR